MVVFFVLLFFMPCWSLAFFFGASFTATADTLEEESELASSSSRSDDGSSAGSVSKTSRGIVIRLWICSIDVMDDGWACDEEVMDGS
jgi:hypothetical protein